MAVHHITDAMIQDKPLFVDSPDHASIKSLLSNHVLVAHSAVFDAGVLHRHGIATPQTVCTLKMARDVLPELEQHKLQYLRYYFGVEFDMPINPHDALSDVLVLEKVFWKLYALIQEKYECSTDAKILEILLDISSRPSLLHMCRFGKYKGTLWKEVPIDYLDWIVNKSSFDDEDVLYTAQYYLEHA